MATQIAPIAMKCAVCGAPLKVTPDMGRFVCMSCGSELFVERGEGTISLKPVTEAISKVQVGTDKTAAELALNRLQQELTTLTAQKRKMENDYGLQYNSTASGRTAVPAILCIGLVTVGGIFSGFYSNLTWVIVGGIVGFAVAVMVYIAMNNTHKKHSEALMIEYNRDMRKMDNTIKDVRQKIAKNRQIAEA